MVMISAILYGFMPMLAKFSYHEGVNVISVLFYRYFFAFIMISLFLIYKKINLQVSLKQFIPITVASIVGTVLTTYSLFLSYDYISTGLASTLHFVYPAITCLFAIFIYKERMGLNKFLALLLSIVGISLLTINNSVEINIHGVIWALLSGLFYAIYIICAANNELKKLSPFVVAFYVFLISCTFFFIWGMVSGEMVLHINHSAIFYLGNLGFWATFVAVILFFMGMQQTGPSKAAILSTFEPLTGVALGLLVFHEQMSVSMFLGGLLILISVYVIAKDKSNVSPKIVK